MYDWPSASNNPTKLEQKNVNMCDSHLVPTSHETKHERASKNLTQTSVSLTPVVIQFRLVDFRKTSKSAWKLFDNKLSNRTDHGIFSLNLHRIGYTVFLILCLMKLTQIHEDSNKCVEERRIIKSVLRL